MVVQLRRQIQHPTGAHLQPVFNPSSDVSRLANTKQLGVSRSLKQYSVMVPCRPVITNSLSDGWTLFCRMSDKWRLCTNHSTFMQGKRKSEYLHQNRRVRPDELCSLRQNVTRCCQHQTPLISSRGLNNPS